MIKKIFISAGFLSLSLAAHAQSNAHVIVQTISSSPDFTHAFLGVRAGGTSTAMQFPEANHNLVYLGGGGYNGSTLYNYNKAGVYLRAGQTWAATANGTYILFTTTLNGTIVPQERMRISDSGNVGIGTDAPIEKLSVNGKIRAKEIIVDTGWADYVFEPNYRLLPLSEIEHHIKEKGYLPDMPSAKEVAEKGVSVGEGQALLLRKVEELTLHLIAQEKEMARLRSEMAELKAARVNLDVSASVR